MKKILTIFSILLLTAGVVNANPVHSPLLPKGPAPIPKIAPYPPRPVVVQQPVYNMAYGNGYPSVTFSIWKLDVTLGL